MRGLERILRVRKLLEEVAQVELGKQLSVRRSIETAAGRQAELSRSARDHGLLLLTACEPGWAAEVADAELFEWKRGRLNTMAAACEPAVDAARRELVDRRRESRQIEALVSAAEAAEQKERARREQKQLDDWFQMRSFTPPGR